MANQQPHRVLTITDFTSTDWEKVIDACIEKDIFQFASALRTESFAAKNLDDVQRAQVFSFLAEASSIGWEPGSSQEIFQPQVTFTDGSRSRIPADYSDQEVDLLKDLVPTIRDPEMRARIADIVWEKSRNYICAQSAIDAYLASAVRLGDPVQWSAAARRLERALKLSRSIGDKVRLKKVVADIEAVLAHHQGADPSYLSSYLMGLLLAVGEGDPNTYSTLADQAAQNARKAGDWRRTRNYLEVKAHWLQRAGKASETNTTKLEAAETYVTEANMEEAAESPNYMRIVYNLDLAIKALRSISGQAARVKELHKRLLGVQPFTLTQMSHVAIPLVTPTETIQNAISAVSGKGFYEGLVQLSLISASPQISQMRQLAIDFAKQAPLSSSTPQTFHSALGRTVAKTSGMKDADENDPAIRSIMFRLADMMRTSVAQIVEAARWQIIREHAVSLRDWDKVVSDNPFVPVGRELLFEQGLHAGLNGNFVVAAHLLIPQIENSCRQMLAARGAIVSTHDQDGIEREKYIHELLPMPEFKLLFGEDLTFDLRGLLVEQESSNLRHGMAHGLYDYWAFQSAPSIYLWWLVLRILCLLIRPQLVPEIKTAPLP